MECYQTEKITKNTIPFFAFFLILTKDSEKTKFALFRYVIYFLIFGSKGYLVTRFLV